MKRERTKVYIYTRVSTTIQVDGYSLEAQKARMKAYCEFSDYEIVGEYEDAGKSGKSIEGRDQFSRMIKDIKKGKDKISYVLVFKLSRFARNAADVLSTLQVMQDYGVNLICVEDGIDSSKDAGKLMISVLSAVAEIERENIRIQTMEGRIQKAKSGKWNGGFAPYGYVLKDGNLEIAEDEAEAIRVIFDKYVNTDLGISGIAKYLESHGIYKKIRQNGKNPLFSRHFINMILKNPVYYGKIAYGKRKTEKVYGTRNQYKQVLSDDYIIADGLHSPIIDKELWEAAQIKRKTIRKQYERVNPSENRVYLLSGILRCPSCGSAMYGTKYYKIKSDGTKYLDFFYYACKHKDKIRGHSCEYRKQVSANVLEGAVEEVIIKLISNPKFAKLMQEKINMKVDSTAIDEEILNLEKQLRLKVAVKEKLIEEIDGLDPDNKYYENIKKDFNKRLFNVYEKIEEIELLLVEVNNKKTAIASERMTVDNIFIVLTSFEKLYQVLNEKEKRQILESLVSEIQIYPEKLKSKQLLKSIKFRLPIIKEVFGENLDNKSEEYKCAFLNRINVDQHIDIDFNLDEFDLTNKEAKATYKEIQEYILKKYNIKIKSLYIAQIKEKYCIKERNCYNHPKNENSKQPKCPPEKEKVILEAFKHFKMIE